MNIMNIILEAVNIPKYFPLRFLFSFAIYLKLIRLASQIMSNVPVALLLSGFTDNYRALIVGTNIGGLGTLIASMASLISFKYIQKKTGI